MKHLLFSQINDVPIQWFDTFDKITIKNAIIKHLSDNKNDVIEHCKEFNKSDLRKFSGYNIINFYKCNSEGKPCKVVIINNKEFLQILK